MARIRTIKPGFWTDSKIVSLSPLARLFFVGMWNFAECDLGHLPDDPPALKRMILPDDDVPSDGLVAELVDAGLVARIQTVGGRRYLHVVRFADHQKLDPRWSPRCSVCTETRAPSPSNTETRVSLAETHPNSVLSRKGQDSKRTKTSSPAPRSTADDEVFARFWETYPRKIGKGEARKAWTKVVKSGVDLNAVISGAERYRDDPQRRRKGDEYTKHPGPWLNAERWTDQLNGNDLAPTTGWWDN